MSLRGGREPAEKKTRITTTFRCPPELVSYIEEAAKAPLRNKTEVITSALELDRDLDQKLRAEEARLSAFAGDNGLEMHSDLAEVLALLVRRGLDAHEKERRKSVSPSRQHPGVMDEAKRK